jgi:formylglycine-generating enzyme required for sulfatase activity
VGDLAVEKSPSALNEMKLGKYPVTVRLAGYEEQLLDAEVKENQVTTVDVPLVRSTGGVQITSTPPGLDVDVEGPSAEAAKQTVRTPAILEKLPTGDYALTFHRAGWPDQKRTITVQRNQRASVQAEFIGGSLEIASTPAGAEVWALGQMIGRTPLKFEDLAPGTFDLEFRLAGYQTAAAHGEVKPNETARASVALARPPGPEPGKGWTIPDLKLEMAPIAAGKFMMGSPPEEEGGFENEGPQTEVTLTRPYWLGRTVVTQAQFVAVMKFNPSKFEGADRPVEEVTWNQAMEFCRKLTERETAAGRLPEGYAYTLPTEAQWEYACRAGTTGPFAGDGKIDDMGWYSLNADNTTHPVGQKRANAWGLYDMHGNVWEWCRDAYDAYPGGSVSDYTGPIFGVTYVIRGGAFYTGARFCRSAHRNAGNSDANNFLGFRIALVATRQPGR